MLTKGAIGNLVNKYRAVLKKCGLLNVFGSLAVAGTLVLGGAGLAVAASVSAPWDQAEVNITNDANKAVPLMPMIQDIEGVGGQNINTTTLNIRGDGELVLTNGARLTHYNYSHTGDPAITGMAVNMSGGKLTITNGSGFSSIDANTVTIGGGEVTLTGTTNGLWENAAYIGAYKGMDITGGTVNMGENSELFAGNHLSITGGTINMQGTATGGDFGNNAAHIMFTGGENTIGGTAKINVAAGNYGVITTGPELNITGGTLTVKSNGNLLLQPDVTRGSGLVYSGDNTSTVNQTGGTVNVAAGGALTVAEGVTYTQTGGTLDNKGTLTVNGLMDLTSGTATNTGAINVVNSATGSTHTGRLQISDTQLAAMVANGKIAVSGDSGAQTWGRIHLGENASVATDLLADANTANKVFVGTHGSIQAQNLTLTGDSLAINANGRIKANSLTLTPSTPNSDFTVTAGQLFLKGEDGSALNVTGTGGLSVDGNSSRAELKLGELSGDGAVNPGGSLNADITATGANAEVRVNAGNWTLAEGKTLDIQGGALTVGGGTDTGYAGNLPAALDVSAGSLKSAAAGNGSTKGINVLQNGVLAGTLDTFLVADGGIIASGLNQIDVANGGTLWIKGEVSSDNLKKNAGTLVTGAGLIKYDKVNVQQNAAGNVDKDKVENSQTVLEGEKVEYDASSGAVINGGYGADALVLNKATGDIASQTVSGDLTLLGDADGNLISAQKADGTAVQVTEVAVAANKNLNLGSAGAVSKGGTLDSKVSLDSGSALNAAAAEYTVGDITAAADGNGTVTASAGATLITGKIGDASGNAVGSVSATGGTVNADSINTNTLTADGGQINADITTGTLNVVNGGGVQAKILNASGAVSVTDGVLIATGTGADASTVDSLALTDAEALVGELTVTNAATLTNGTSLNAEKLTMASGNLTVGSNADTKGGTTLVVDALNLNGHDLLIDPAWGMDSTNVVVDSFTDGNVTPDLSINGNVGVGMNSMAAIGTTDESWLAGQVNAATNGAGLTENGVDSALGIYSAQVLGNGNGIVVDGTKTSTGGTAFTFNSDQLDFSGKSLLVVNADAALAPAGALSAAAASTANIADGAKLRIAGAEVGETYKVLGANISINKTGEAWSNANFSTDSLMVAGGAFDAATGTIKTSLNSARNVLPSLDNELADVLDAGYLNHEIGTADKYLHSDVKGVRFLSRATSRDFIGGDAKQAAVTIESAARMALVGAVPQMTMAASNAAGNAVTQRTSLAQPGGNAIQSMGTDGSMQTGASAGDAAKTGFAMWIMPLYQSSNGFGMKAGNFDMDFSGGLGGVAIGADYTFDNAIRAGITFNIGGGYATGSGDLNETTNDMNFWGIGAYAGWAQNNFGVTADVNYTSTYNKLEQDLPAGMQMGKLKSDVTAYAISAGLRGEYKFETSVMDITPHVGVRYMSLNTDEYDVKSGGTVLKGDAINQNIWTFPIGVAFSKRIETGNGWHFKPSLDLAVIPAAGDIDARSDVRFTGTGTKAELDTQTMDYVSYMGQAGLEFGNETTSLGVNYNIQLGAKSTAHGVFGTFRYEF